MRIGNDISIFASNQLSRTTSVIARSLQRLSSGLRVSSPQDDVAAFSEGVKLDSQIRGYTQAARNINDAAGLVQTASSAIDTQIGIVQKMREIAVQASNGSLSSTDRANLNTQVQALYQEFSRITSSTQFNGINLLDGSFGTRSLQVGSTQGDSYSLAIPSLQGSSTFQKKVGSGKLQSNFITNSFSTSGFGNYISVGDFNNDGKIDYLSAESDIHLYLGHGDGTFSLSQSIVMGTGIPFFVQGKDLNGDGILDLVYQEGNSSTLNARLGNGDGTFKASINTVDLSDTSHSFADINHDGKLDLVTTGGVSNIVSIFLGNGDGSFVTPRTIGLSTGASSSSLVDLNKDGNLDMVVGVGSSTSTLVMLGNGDATFKTPTTLTSGTAGVVGLNAVGDVNRDGILDIVSASGGNFNIFLGNGDATFQSRLTATDSGTALDYKLADMNGDGVLDLVKATFSGTSIVSVLIGNGDGTFKSATTSPLSGSLDSNLEISDLNGDGVPDVITDDDGGQTILLGNALTVSAVSNLSIQTQSDASLLLSILDSALANLKNDQAQLGAVHDRLFQSSAFSSLMIDNLAAAKSNTLDVDIALETSELVRNQILQQAQVAVLGQANISSQVVLSLLKNLNSN